MNRWEYEIVQVDVEGGQWTVGGKANPAVVKDALNKLGEQGWEMVSGFDTNQSGGATRQVVLLLKRLK
jgi:hypothetical protein